MSKEERFEWYYCDGIENVVVVDTKTKSEYVDDNIANLLNKQDQEIQELKKQLKNAVIPNKEYYVIVTNGWEKQVYGVAKVHQRLEDVYTYCTDNTIGCFSPLTQYGTFDTLEDANERLKELKKEKYANNRRK